MEVNAQSEQTTFETAVPKKQTKSKKATKLWLIWVAIAILFLGAAAAAVLIWKPPFLFGNTATDQATATAPDVTVPAETPETPKTPFVVYNEITEHITTYSENGEIDKIEEVRYILIYDDQGEERNRFCYYNSDEILNIAETREEGRLTSVTISSPQGEFLSRKDFTYNQKGQLSAYTCRFDSGYTGEYTFDDFGNMTSEIWYSGDNLEDKNIWEYTYNADGNVTLQLLYQNDSDRAYKTEYTYDADGKLASKTQYDKDGKMRYECTYSAGNLISDIRYDKYYGKYYHYEYTYDAAGNKLSEISYNNDNTVIEKYTWLYDANGNVIEHTYFSDKNGTTKTEYIYDADGNKNMEIIYGETGNIKGTYTWKINADSAGNIVLETKFDKSGNVVELYRYDTDGNMISAICYDKNGNITEKTEWEYIVTDDSRIKTEKQYYKNGNIKSKTTITESRPVTYYK